MLLATSHPQTACRSPANGGLQEAGLSHALHLRANHLVAPYRKQLCLDEGPDERPVAGGDSLEQGPLHPATTDPDPDQPCIKQGPLSPASTDPLPSEQVDHADPNPHLLYNSYPEGPPPSCRPLLLNVTFMRMPAFLPRLTLVMIWGLRSPTSEARCVRSTWAIWEDAPRSSWWGDGGGGGGRK